MPKGKNVERDDNAQPTIALVAGDNRSLSQAVRDHLRTIGAVTHGAAAADKHAEVTRARTYDAMHASGIESCEYLAPVADDYPMGKHDPEFERDYRFFQSKQLEIAIGAVEDREIHLDNMRSRDPEGGWEPMPAVIMKDLPKLLFELKTENQLAKAGYAPIVHTHIEAIKAAMRLGMKRTREGLETRENADNPIVKTEAQRKADKLFAAYRQTAAEEDIDADKQTAALDHLVAVSHICGYHQEFMALVDKV